MKKLGIIFKLKAKDLQKLNFLAVVAIVSVALPLTVLLVLQTQNFISKAAGTNYYVDSVSGSDSNNGTSESSPWKSLSPVNSKLFAPGDNINFKKGSSWTGGLTIRSSGNASNPITFKAYGSGNAPSVANPGTYTRSITIDGASYVIVQDFLLQNSHEAGVSVINGASHNIIQSNECTKVGTCVTVVSGQYNLITKNNAHDLTMIIATSGGDDDYGATGYWLYDSYNEVSYNRCVNCRAYSPDYGNDGGGVEIYADGKTVTGTKIHHNYFKGTNGVMEIGGKGGTVSNVNISYNVSDNNYEDFMMFHLTGTFAVTLQNFTVDNNTIVQNGGYRILDFGGTPASNAVNFRNNLVYSNIGVSNNSSFTHTNNLYYLYNGAALGFSLASGEKQGDPLFVGLSNGDYHLGSNSPAINAGANLGYTLDFDGNAVPTNSAPDMGAFEFGSNSITPSPTVNPTITPTVPPADTTVINDATIGTGNDQFEYVGTWEAGAGTEKYNGDDHYSNVTDSYYQLRFVGTQIKLYGAHDVHHGIGAVSIDGGAEADVDFYGSTRVESMVVWTSPTLSYGNHIVKMRVKGTKNASSSDYYLSIDRADILSVVPTSTPIPTATATPKPTNTPVPTATSTPVPTATNTPIPTVTPRPTNTPIPTATNTPVPTVTSAPTATPTPIPCSLLAASWSRADAVEGDTVRLNVTTSSNCSGQVVPFEIHRNGLGDELSAIRVQPSARTVVGTFVSTSWVVEHNPLIPLTDPDYYFKAYFNGSAITSSDPMLHVTAKTDPTPTPSPIPTATPSVVPTNTPVPTSTPIVPTSTLMPTPTIVPDTNIILALKLVGVGNGINENTMPNRGSRTVKISLYNLDNQFVQEISGNLNYQNFEYRGSLPLGPATQNGYYYMKASLGDASLTKMIGGMAQKINSGTDNFIPEAILYNGDINNDNIMDINDYNELLTCYGTRQCVRKTNADLNDDGKVDGLDYITLLRGFSARQGD